MKYIKHWTFAVNVVICGAIGLLSLACDDDTYPSVTVPEGCLTSLKPADLLFHVPERANPITNVTPNMMDHVVICLNEDSIIEAVPGRGVQKSSLAMVKARGGQYLIGRTKADVQKSLLNARSYVGCPYDSLFLADNGAIYCSELVQLSFVDSCGNAVFSMVPMTFRDEDGNIPTYWIYYYSSFGMDVPEGEPGTNPGEMYGRVSKYLGVLR